MIAVLSFLLSAQVFTTPPPPPPPRVAESPLIRDAIAKAGVCVANGESWQEAGRAVRDLEEPVGSEAWKSVREIVFRHLGQRDKARECLWELERVRYSESMSAEDRAVLHQSIRAYHNIYANMAIHTEKLLAQFIGYDVGNEPMVFANPL